MLRGGEASEVTKTNNLLFHCRSAWPVQDGCFYRCCLYARCSS